MASAAQRQELAAFLRSRREAIGPGEVGLEPGPRRRTPGLRREEVAHLSGVGVTWYTWLEQQRDITVSRQVVDALARALRLTPAERRHLFALTGQPLPAESIGRPQVGPILRALVNQLNPNPAYVIDDYWNILAWNRAQDRLVGGLDHLAEEECNTIWLLFTRPAWRQLLCDWAEEARRLVGQFRAVAGQHADEPRVHALVEGLHAASLEFRELWADHPIQAFTPARKQFQHPLVGRLTLDYVKLAPVENPSLHLVTYLPADAVTAARLDELAGTAGALAAAPLAG